MRALRSAVLGLFACSVAVAVVATWLGRRVAGIELAEGTSGGLSPLIPWLMLSFTGVGAIVAVRQPRNPIGWMFIAIGLLWQIETIAGSARLYLADVRPELPGDGLAAWMYDVVWIVPFALLPAVVAVLPTGRLVSGRWSWIPISLAAASIATIVAVGFGPGELSSTPIENPVGIAALDAIAPPLEAFGSLLFVVATLGAAVSLVVRFRHGDAIERQQLLWVALAVGVVIAGLIAANVAQALGLGADGAAVVRVVPLATVPIACGVAVLRYRLFDIDLVISGAMVYTTLAAGIVVIYVAVVVGVGRLLGARDEPDLVLAVVTTAAVAVAFDPARRALQRAADRAVYGRRATPYEALASMTRRVGDEFGVDDVIERMTAVIADATGGSVEVLLTDEDRGRDVSAGDVFPVHRDGRVLGSLVVTKPTGERLNSTERRLLTDLAESASLVLDNAQMLAELRSSRQRLVAAQHDERRRMERDLHDGAQQRLMELSLTLGRARRLLADEEVRSEGASDVADLVDQACDQLGHALAELRDLARGIYPSILSERGLEPALASLASRLRLPGQIDVAIGPRPPPVVETTAYFVVAEAVTNVVKHAAASSVRITGRRVGGLLAVEVVDDGVGGADPAGAGLRGLADRVLAVGGDLSVASSPGAGTSIRVELPCG